VAAKSFPTNTDLGLFVLRLWLGLVGVLHGTQKIFTGEGIGVFAGFLEKLHVPAPTLSAWMAALSELVGGLVIALGLWTRLAAIPFAITMLVAWATAHKFQFFAQSGGGEYPLTLAVAALVIAVSGPGKWTVARFTQRA